MRSLLLVFFLIALYGSNEFSSNKEDTCLEILEYPSKDSVFINPVYFCQDTLGKKIYYSPLNTAVCNDTLCQIVFLKIFWDLAGNFSGFDTLPEKPLTKYDHKPFTPEDYKKLYHTLKNETSILGDKTEEELLDGTRYSEKIDGVTGATALEIKSEIVDGALYSSYTLWHIANGEIKPKLRNYTLSHYDSNIQQQLLESENPKTIIFGLKNLDEEFYKTQFDQIIELMKRENSLVNFYIAKNISASILDYSANKKKLLEIWNRLDLNTQSVLSKYLEH